MNLLSKYPWIRKVSAAIPEVWFITFLAILAHSNLDCLNSGHWHFGNTITISVCFLVIILLVVQVIRKSGWTNLLFGLLFAWGAGIIFCHFLSSYSKASLDPELTVIKLITGISMTTASFLFACTMLKRGIRKIYS